MTRRAKPIREGDSPRARDIRAERSRALAERTREGPTEETRTVLLCEASGGLYGVPLGEVARVEPFGHLSAAPAGHPAFLGLSTISGRVLPVLDLDGLTGAGPTRAPGGYIIAPRDQLAAVRTMARPDAVEVRPLPEDSGRAIIVSAGEHQGRMLGLLSLNTLLAMPAALSVTGA
ncbi:MAG: chemotaxis protein CheW [Phenylobacterium sp.]|nr:chemotaxis protein CheW [Phenylobacterium sp.]